MIQACVTGISALLAVAGAGLESTPAIGAGVLGVASMQIWAMSQFADLRERLARLEARR